MVEATKKPVVRKAAASKSPTAEKKAPVKTVAKEAAVWPFPEVEKAAAAKPAKKAPAAETAVKKPAARKAAAPKAKPAAAQPTPQERYEMVQTAAYFIAERANFQGCSLSHWAEAEREIAEKLGC